MNTSAKSGLFTIINEIDNTLLFKYIIVMIVTYVIFRNKIIGLNTILGIMCGIIVIIYIYDKNKVLLETTDEEYKKKLDSIQPNLKTNFKNNRELIDFIFSIQDMYGNNPQTFEEMIDNINAILELENILEKEKLHYSQVYNIAYDKKNNALNCLNSMIYSIKSDGNLTDKLVRSHKRLETLLNKILNKMYNICYQNLETDGYNIHTNIINTGPNPYNMYVDKDFTFQLY